MRPYFPELWVVFGDAIFRFPDVIPAFVFSEFGGFLKQLPGQISGKFGDLSESKFLDNFVPGVSVSLLLFLFPRLFLCVRILFVL